MLNQCFVIHTDDPPIVYLKTKDKRLAKIIDQIGNIECTIHQNLYEFIIFEIVGQMLSNKVADVLCDRLLELCRGDVSPDVISGLSYDEIRSIGISNAKTEYIQNFTSAIQSGSIDLESLSDLDDIAVMGKLMSIRGIGSWTSKMFLLFVLQRENILPFEDGAFKQSFSWLYGIDNPTKEIIEQKCRKWRPYSSYAARYLYRALDMGLTKNSFNEWSKNI